MTIRHLIEKMRESWIWKAVKWQNATEQVKILFPKSYFDFLAWGP